jgi:hypothetical protein
MKAENDHDEKLLDYAERLQDECKDLKRINDDLRKCIDLQMEGSSKRHENIKKAREELQSLRGCSCSCSDGIIDDVEDILDKYLGEVKDDKSDRNK